MRLHDRYTIRSNFCGILAVKRVRKTILTRSPRENPDVGTDRSCTPISLSSPATGQVSHTAGQVHSATTIPYTVIRLTHCQLLAYGEESTNG